MDKSRYTIRTDTENTVNKEKKSRSISITSLSGKITRIEKPSEIDISNENLSIFVLSGHGKSLSSVTLDQQHIPRTNKRKKISDTFITRKENIQEPVYPSKRAKEDTIPDVEKVFQNKELQHFGIR